MVKRQLNIPNKFLRKYYLCKIIMGKRKQRKILVVKNNDE